MALLIQAAGGEILRMRALPKDGDGLVSFENLADDLAAAHDLAYQTESGLPPDERLVRPQP
jgi:hypothetical protein